MSLLHITADNFEELVMNNEKTVLLDFYADWCGPCRMVAPLVEQIANEHPEYTVGKINVDNDPDLARKYEVASIPTLIVVKNGKTVSVTVGARPKDQILTLLEQA